MPSRYMRSDTALFAVEAVRDMKKMRAELNEHRYALERNVERETAHLLKRIAVLESCNAALSARLAAAQKEIAVLGWQSAPPAHAEPGERAAKLYVMQKPPVPEKWGGQTVAA